VIVAVSLRPQQCDNFCKIQEHVKWSGTVKYVWWFIMFFTLGLLYRCLLHSFEGKIAVCTVQLLTVLFLDLAHSVCHLF